MTRMGFPFVVLLLGALTSGCSYLNLRAVPFGTYAPLHNQAAKTFVQTPVTIGALPADGLPVKPLDDDHRLVGLAVSGGGMRATAFTLGVLAELGKIPVGNNTALQAIDFISSNSGGSWAVAAYLADRATVAQPTYDLDARSRVIGDRFDALSKGKVLCWANRFIPIVTRDKTFAEIYGSNGNSGTLPRVFFNASLMPAQMPFVFTDPFIDQYAVTRFEGACDGVTFDASRGLAQMPFGFAAATSGSVPTFTHSWAETKLCSAATSKPSFCFDRLRGGHRDHLHLSDGGLYDNLGYKTAFEVARATAAQRPQLHRAMIFIDSADDEAYQTVSQADRHSDHAFKTLLASTFPHQNATFRRMRGPMFTAAGFEQQVVLDFNAAGSFREEAHAVHLNDLNALSYFAANSVSCFADDEEQLDAPKRAARPPDFGSPSDHIATLKRRGADCLSENFARAGSLHKTTYLYDAYFFLVRYQLGRLAVKMRRDEIVKALR